MNRLRCDWFKEANNGSVPQGNKELSDVGVVSVERHTLRATAYRVVVEVVVAMCMRCN